MSSNRPFSYNSANSTFSSQNQFSDAGDYIKQKKIQYSFCNPNICKSNQNVNSYSNLLDLKKANSNALYNYSNFDKSELYSNLYSILDLTNATTISTLDGQKPVNLNNTINVENYVIDPSGELFGITPCGLYNYENYLVYNKCFLKNNNN